MKRFLVNDPSTNYWYQLSWVEVADYVSLRAPATILRNDVTRWAEAARNGDGLSIGSERVIVIDDDGVDLTPIHQIYSEDHHHRTLGSLLMEYARLVSRHGVGSKEVGDFVEKYKTDAEFAKLATLSQDLKLALSPDHG